jgi:Protein of unknown function (DUF3565)
MVRALAPLVGLGLIVNGPERVVRPRAGDCARNDPCSRAYHLAQPRLVISPSLEDKYRDAARRADTVTRMKRKIVGFHTDDEGHWVAELECGHDQHVRHAPPITERPWVMTEKGRASRLGQELNCVKCDDETRPT